MLEFRSGFWQGKREQINILVCQAATLINYSENTASKAFKELEQHGFIELLEPHIWTQGKARVYRLTFEKHNKKNQRANGRSMFKLIRKILTRDIVYLQIWENRLRARALRIGSEFDEVPLLAIEEKNSQQIICAVGNSCLELKNRPNIKVVNPFSHSRIWISDFPVAEKIIQHVISLLFKHSFVKPSPYVIVHVMEKNDGGLNFIEIKAAKDLALAAGASDVFVFEGSETEIINRPIEEVYKLSCH